MPSMANASEGGVGVGQKSNGVPSSAKNRSVEQSQSLARKASIAQQRRSLPIASELPQFLFNGGFCDGGKVIGITQPRRVAAVTVAKRVAEECGIELGQKVGYSIRFEDVTSRSTRIKYMTDGLLLRYSVILVDEAHERTVHTDVLLGLLKDVQRARSKYNTTQNNSDKVNGNYSAVSGKEGITHCPSYLKPCQGAKFFPLKLIIMSASLDARGFSEYFGGARAVHIQGRQYPVDILYTYDPVRDYLNAALITILQEEIESVERLVRERIRHLPLSSQNVVTVSIYSSLPSEQQMKVFRPPPPGCRKVILATNIAETSVTIPGIKYVIDPGVVKARDYSAKTGLESLVIVPTSKAQALQRSGRAGREGPGKCFRLYPESVFFELKDSTLPEIKRCNLSSIVLQLKALGIDDIIGFDFMDKPDRDSIKKSLEQLIALGALTDEYKLSDPVGQQMSRLPLDPIHSKAIILATQYNCLEEMLITVSMLSVESIFYSPHDKLEEAKVAWKRFSCLEGDHITLINVYRASVEFIEKSKIKESRVKAIEGNLKKWCRENFINNRSLRHAQDVHSQIRGHVQQMGLTVNSCGDDMLQFRRCLAASFFLNAALKQPDGSYRAMESGQRVQIHPSSMISGTKPDCVIYNELVQTNRPYLRYVTRIDPLWLPELAPQYYAAQT
ncbi:putative pre-mRNA-splicing factor ATP-dependent RNA helicase [Acorus calamus]|uniref:RNA helicase n=1 Tax=Acorus calamus TaxID=4465 RepID=A0AAV9D0Z9_ACOCL|nr:putative pre-mRNA-splicing factor ATP-dependent RNA helicase [Acorus calamus]